MLRLFCLFSYCLLLSPLVFAQKTDSVSARTIPSNRSWDSLTVPSGTLQHRKLFFQAGQRLGRWHFYLDHIKFDAAKLKKLARTQPKQPFTRVVREQLRRPLDLLDFLYFVDDVLAAGQKGLRGKLVWVSASRARRAGIFIHPDDVFLENQPRLYGVAKKQLEIDRPKRITQLSPARDGEVLGPRWCSRFPNPSGRKNKLEALNKRHPKRAYGDRVALLMKQFKQQGATVLLYSTVRDRRRGYLIWGAYLLSRQQNPQDLAQSIAKLNRLNAEWNLNIPIQWQHAGGWRTTVDLARQMADSYMVAYASETGAKSSNHYAGNAVDLNVFGLPRRLTLIAPDQSRRVFDLSAAEETRDLSLTPQLIDWVEQHFQMRKLKNDYPHWDDAAEDTEATTTSKQSKRL